jgi:NADH:ubiquinone oxidoreductase subunit 4 (subunit M)
MAVIATLGVLAATFYALRFVQRAFHGPNTHEWQLPDLSFREALVVGSMIVAFYRDPSSYLVGFLLGGVIGSGR